jgi:NAD-dependent deacetylase sirtuin 5
MSTRRGPSTSVQEFAKILKEIHARKGRVLALCGAGLSAASGLGTFRGAGGMWRKYKATSLATREAFEVDPGLVVSIYFVGLLLRRRVLWWGLEYTRVKHGGW